MIFKDLCELNPHGFIAEELASGKWHMNHDNDDSGSGYICRRGNRRQFNSFDAIVSTIKRAGFDHFTIEVEAHNDIQ